MTRSAQSSSASGRSALGSLFLFSVLLLVALGCFYGDSTALPESDKATLDARLDSLLAAYAPFQQAQPGLPDADEVQVWVDSVYATLTLEERIGQLLIVDLDPAELNGLEHTDEAVTGYQVGGFLVPRLLGPEEVFEVTNRLQALTRVPLFFAADYERGVGRFNNNLTEFPANMGLGATRNRRLAEAAGMITAIEARAIGINLLFAPVVDVNNNPDNPIINIRSYGESARLVGELAASFVNGAHTHGILTTLKHFPGHGNTSVDSHVRLGTVEGNAAALDTVELLPYRMLTLAPHFEPAVMTAHLWTKAYDREPLPATISRHVLTDLLRDSLGFGGLVVTDHIRMGALSQTYSYAERVVRPFIAGADLILGPNQIAPAVAAIEQALSDGRLREDQFEASVRRVLRAKARLHLHDSPTRDSQYVQDLLAKPLGEPVAHLMATEAMTLLKSDAVPLRPEAHVALIQMTNQRQSSTIRNGMKRLRERLEDYTPIVERADQDQADVIVLALYLRIGIGGGLSLDEEDHKVIQSLMGSNRPLVLVTFGNPYAVTTFPEAEGILVAYDQSMASVEAAADVLTGIRPAPGRLPITVGPYAFGSGHPVSPSMK